jgi:hypothetical protein
VADLPQLGSTAHLPNELALLSVDRETAVGSRIGGAILRQGTNLRRIHRCRQSLRLLVHDLRLRLIDHLRLAQSLIGPETCYASEDALFMGTPSMGR